MMLAAVALAATLSPFDQVVAAERAFAAASVTNGLHESFLANLSDDAIAYVPLPAPARAQHQGQPHSTGILTWGPAWVAVSSAGDLALSTGPWQLRAPENPLLKSETTGWFLSVWRKQTDGSWKVAVDAGISVPLQFEIPTTVENGFAGESAKPKPPSGAADAKAAIGQAEKRFTTAAKGGIGAAVAAQAESRLRVYREHKPAAEGLEAAQRVLTADRRKATCSPDKIVTSASGDLGYTYGTCVGIEKFESSKYGFLHVWHKAPDDSWKLLVDVTP